MYKFKIYNGFSDENKFNIINKDGFILYMDRGNDYIYDIIEGKDINKIVKYIKKEYKDLDILIEYDGKLPNEIIFPDNFNILNEDYLRSEINNIKDLDTLDTKTKTLIIKGHNIDCEFPSYIFENFKEIINLYIIDTNIKGFVDFKNIYKLEYLHIENNEYLTGINLDIFNNEEFSKLYISNNKNLFKSSNWILNIGEIYIDNFIVNNSNLKYIIFHEIPKIGTFDVSSNPITDVKFSNNVKFSNINDLFIIKLNNTSFKCVLKFLDIFEIRQRVVHFNMDNDHYYDEDFEIFSNKVIEIYSDKNIRDCWLNVNEKTSTYIFYDIIRKFVNFKVNDIQRFANVFFYHDIKSSDCQYTWNNGKKMILLMDYIFDIVNDSSKIYIHKDKKLYKTLLRMFDSFMNYTFYKFSTFTKQECEKYRTNVNKYIK